MSDSKPMKPSQKPAGCKCHTRVVMEQVDGKVKLRPAVEWNPGCPVHKDAPVEVTK